MRTGVLLWWVEDSLKRISTSVLPHSLTINAGSPGMGWGLWWGEGPGEATCRTPTLDFLPLFSSLPWLRLAPGNEWSPIQPTSRMNRRSRLIQRRLWERGSRQPEKHWRGSGHEHHAVARSWSTRAVSSPKWRLSFRGASCQFWAHPRCGKCQGRGTSLQEPFKTESETSSPVSLSRGGAPSPFHI